MDHLIDEKKLVRMYQKVRGWKNEFIEKGGKELRDCGKIKRERERKREGERDKERKIEEETHQFRR